MLALRPNCECCNRDLAPDRDIAYICSFECTFCTDCTAHMQAVCPNCGGELVARPRRSTGKLVNNPASTERVYKPAECAAAVYDKVDSGLQLCRNRPKREVGCE